MNSSIITNATSLDKNPWEESGAMVYVAITVATFSAVTMCCVWFFKQRWLKTTTYGTVNNKEDIELTTGQDSSSEEELPLDESEYKDDLFEEAEPDSKAFSLDDSGSSEEEHELYKKSKTTFEHGDNKAWPPRCSTTQQCGRQCISHGPHVQRRPYDSNKNSQRAFVFRGHGP